MTPIRFNNSEETVLRFALPGVTEADLSIQLAENILTIRAERSMTKGQHLLLRELSTGPWERRYSLDAQYDQENISATFVNGQLELRLTKQNRNKTIAINAA